MGYESWSEQGYGIFLSSEDIEKIKTYLQDNDAEYQKIDEDWATYLKKNHFKDLKGFMLHSNGVDYRFHSSVEDSWGCYIGVDLWKSMQKLLQEGLKKKITVPDNVHKKWDTIYSLLKKCGIKRRKPTFFYYIVTG